MLELRPNCEWCDRDLPPDSAEARICSYECTFCARCVEEVLGNVCPSCGGGFAPRPIRPKRRWRDAPPLGLSAHPASTERRRSRHDAAEVARMRARLECVPPEAR